MEAQTGRNDPCPCGSGKKYKKCCYEKDMKKARPSVFRFAQPAKLTNRTIKATVQSGKSAVSSTVQGVGSSAAEAFKKRFKVVETAPSPKSVEEDLLIPFDKADYRETSSSENPAEEKI